MRGALTATLCLIPLAVQAQGATTHHDHHIMEQSAPSQSDPPLKIIINPEARGERGDVGQPATAGAMWHAGGLTYQDHQPGLCHLALESAARRRRATRNGTGFSS